jgi:transmembrane sensor
MIREVLTVDRLLAMGPDAAGALLAVRRSDGGSAHDEALLEAWLQADDAHARAWARTQAGWNAFDDAADDELLAAMRSAAVGARPSRALPRERLAAAAVIVVLLSGVLFGLVLNNSWRAEPEALRTASSQAPSQAFFTAAGQRRAVILADGSRLTLDSDSRVEVAFSDRRRDLRLRQGHAFFEVAHDRQRPFAVRAGDRQVTALGTRFDVRVDPGRVRVVLVEGSVSVAASDPTAALVVLKPGERLEAKAGQPPVVALADIDAVLDWQENFVTFDDTPLSEVARLLTQAGPDRIVVRDPAVARFRISGRFQTGDLARFSRALAAVHPVRLVEIAPHQFEIVPAR